MSAVVVWLLIMLSTTCLAIALYPLVSPYFRRTRQRVRILANLNKDRRKSKFEQLERMLYLVSKKYEESVSVYRFFMLTTLVFVMTFITVYIFTSGLSINISNSNPFASSSSLQPNIKVNIGFSLFISLIALSMPYLVLRVRYAAKIVRAGYDLLDVLKILSKHSHLAVDTALSRTADELLVTNVLKQPLKLLSFTFASYTYERELQVELQRFVKVIDTTFAISFATDLAHTYMSGGHMQHFLNSLIESMENQLLVINEAKKEFADGISLGKWINLFSVIIVCGGTSAMIGWSVYSKLQFQTSQGILAAGFIILSILISFVTSLILSKPRLDYK